MKISPAFPTRKGATVLKVFEPDVDHLERSFEKSITDPLMFMSTYTFFVQNQRKSVPLFLLVKGQRLVQINEKTGSVRFWTSRCPFKTGKSGTDFQEICSAFPTRKRTTVLKVFCS